MTILLIDEGSWWIITSNIVRESAIELSMAKANGIASTNGGALIDSDSLSMNECIICHEDFDLSDHIPKMLDFCHHSLCITCIKVNFIPKLLTSCHDLFPI